MEEVDVTGVELSKLLSCLITVGHHPDPHLPLGTPATDIWDSLELQHLQQCRANGCLSQA